jgi:hypothetical protein
LFEHDALNDNYFVIFEDNFAGVIIVLSLLKLFEHDELNDNYFVIFGYNFASVIIVLSFH